MTNVVAGIFDFNNPPGTIVSADSVPPGATGKFFAIGAFTDLVGLPTTPFPDSTAWIAFSEALIAKTTGVSSIALNVNIDAGVLVVVGGNGDDVIGLSPNPQNGPATLYGNAGNDALTGGRTLDKLYGGIGNDLLSGNAAEDILNGGDGNDTIDGGAGGDFVTGGLGRDRMTGGVGEADTFIFDAPSEIGKKAGTRDTITDFETGLDTIYIGEIDARINSGGNQAFKFIGGHDFDGMAGRLHSIKVDKPGHKKDLTRIEGDANGDARPDFKLELTGLHKLTADDFVL